jgi:hypothetical protein
MFVFASSAETVTLESIFGAASLISGASEGVNDAAKRAAPIATISSGLRSLLTDFL